MRRFKNFLQARYLSFASLVLLFFCSCGENTPSQDQRPNIILIYTDDQGTIDMGCYGASDLHTPHMDELAQSGVRFTEFYAASPVCSPSRAALLTGLTPVRAGLADNAPSHHDREGGLPSEAFTLAEALKEAGYTTGHIGKWHLGYTKANMPLAQGFDYSFGHMGGCIDNYSHFFYWSGPNTHDLWRNGEEVWYDGAYFPSLMEQEAESFIKQNQYAPFFLYYAFNMPHYPLQGVDKWREYYKDLPSPRKEYAAFLSSLDEKIGSLVQTLERLSLRENTIIVVQSDHGHSTEIRTMGGGGNAGPHRGAKFSVFEGGIKVPALISYPAVIPAAQVREQLASNIDWFPTLVDFAGLDPTRWELEGLSLKKAILEDQSHPERHLIWKYGHQWAVRKGNHKLMFKPIDPTLDPKKFWYPVCDSLYLVDLARDPGEQNNLFGTEAEVTDELVALYHTWQENLP